MESRINSCFIESTYLSFIPHDNIARLKIESPGRRNKKPRWIPAFYYFCGSRLVCFVTILNPLHDMRVSILSDFLFCLFRYPSKLKQTVILSPTLIFSLSLKGFLKATKKSPPFFIINFIFHVVLPTEAIIGYMPHVSLFYALALWCIFLVLQQIPSHQRLEIILLFLRTYNRISCRFRSQIWFDCVPCVTFGNSLQPFFRPHVKALCDQLPSLKYPIVFSLFSAFYKMGKYHPVFHTLLVSFCR